MSTTDPVVGTDLSFDGDIEVPEILTADTVVVKTGSHIAPITGGNLSLRVAGTLTVEAGARIEVNGNGYLPGGAPAWVIAAAERYSAGAHGGVETNSAVSAEQRVFDSVYVPQMPGGGGALLGGGMGGGVLAIHAGTVVLDGEIEANGVSNGGDGGPPGAGGSVFIRAETLLGSGSIDSSGGDGVDSCYWLYAPASGGGRVALDVAILSGFDPLTQITAHGGAVRNCNDTPLRYASPGTVLVRTDELPLGELIVDNGTEEDGTPRSNRKMTFLPPLGSGAVLSVDATGSDAWITGSEPFRPRWVGAWVALSDSSGADLGLFEVLEIDASGRALAGGAGSVASPASYRGQYRFDRISLRNDSGVWADDPMTSGDQVFDEDVSIQGTLKTETFLIQSGVTVEARGPQFRLQVAGQLTIESGATLQADEQGYATGGAPDGVAGSMGTSGGSHGGTGSHSTVNGSAGEVYDGVYGPGLPGGGGAPGGRNQGRAGGGAIEILAAEVVLDGEIRAVSKDSVTDFDQAGAGGTISIKTGILSGTGSIDASGGWGAHTAYSYRGAGGGGRVALLADTLVGFDPASQVRAAGGGHKVKSTNLFASPGTIFVKELSNTYGRLIVDADVPDTVGSPSVLPTLLPTIGRGSVGSITIDSQDPADLWVEDQDPGRLFSLGVIGMWMRIGGVDYPVIDQSADRSRFLLDGAAGSVVTGDAYDGIYKFDSVTVTGDAQLEMHDGDVVADWTVDPGSTVTRFDIEPPTIAVISPAAGSQYVAGDPVAIVGGHHRSQRIGLGDLQVGRPVVRGRRGTLRVDRAGAGRGGRAGRADRDRGDGRKRQLVDSPALDPRATRSAGRSAGGHDRLPERRGPSRSRYGSRFRGRGDP